LAPELCLDSVKMPVVIQFTQDDSNLS